MTLRRRFEEVGQKIFVPPSKRKSRRQLTQEDQTRIQEKKKHDARMKVFKMEEEEAYAEGRAEGARTRGRYEASRHGGGMAGKVGSGFVTVMKHLPDPEETRRNLGFGGGGFSSEGYGMSPNTRGISESLGGFGFGSQERTRKRPQSKRASSSNGKTITIHVGGGGQQRHRKRRPQQSSYADFGF